MNGFEVILPFLKPIEHLILDDSISEVMVNGTERIFVEKSGFLEQVQGVSLSERSLLVAVKNIARRLGDDISESKPILDSRLPDGSRVAAVIPPCSLNGITLTIRKFNSRHFDMEDLIRVGTLDRQLANRLEDYVLRKKSLLICGGTGSGKSTLTAALARFIPEDERIVLIEDTAELHLLQTNLVRFEARREQSGVPAVSIRDLLKASLRHRQTESSWVRSVRRGIRPVATPEYRSRRHALDNPCKFSEARSRAVHELRPRERCELPYSAIKTNVADFIEVLVHVERRPGKRFISEVLELHGYNPDADHFDFTLVFSRSS